MQARILITLRGLPRIVLTVTPLPDHDGIQRFKITSEDFVHQLAATNLQPEDVRAFVLDNSHLLDE